MIKIINSSNEIALSKLLSRSQFNDELVNETVLSIVKDVKENKDLAVRKYTNKFDHVDIKDFKVTKDEILNAYKNIDKKIIKDLMIAKKNIWAFHKKQMPKSYKITSGEKQLEQRISAITNVGIYVPGGTAAYPSTVLMNSIPAKIAGCKKIVMITPPNKEGLIKDSLLVAADLVGVDEIYKVGGAQGIAAIAYGTNTIPKVDLIVGPGNVYVQMAKKALIGVVGIDMVAGPSEILVIADDDANPNYIAADLMSQAEHDIDSASICLTTSIKLAQNIKKALTSQITGLERKEIIKESLERNGAIIITNSLEESITLSNLIAPEHLELLIKNPFDVVDQIKNAGAIFIGPYTPEAIGDYIAGTNHTLPTSGTARFKSALSVTDFIKKTSIVYYDKKSFDQVKNSVVRLANEEGLRAHANSILVRDKE
jgi:histidinol dehydrogenase